MAKIPFIGTYEGRSKEAGALRCVNLYPDMSEGGVTLKLFGTPGLTSWASLGASPVRGFHVVGDVLHCVAGKKYYTINTAGVATVNAVELTTSSGTVYFSDNGLQVVVVDGTFGYYYTIATGVLAKIVDADFPVPGSVTYLDSYILVHAVNTGNMHGSSSYAAQTYAALDYLNAEAQSDNLVRVIALHQSVFLLGSHSLQVAYHVGGTGFPFSVNPAMTTNTGCLSAATVCRTGDAGNILMWLAQNKQGTGYVVRTDGDTPVSVSNPELEHLWGEYSTLADATAYAYREDGHTFYVISFPTAGKTWAYDLGVGAWHERSSGLAGGRHKGEKYAYHFGKHLVSDATVGEIYEMDLNTYTDAGAPILRTLVMPHLSDVEKRHTYSQMQVVIAAGVGIPVGQGVDPQAMLSWSTDYGHTYGNEHYASMGAQGNFGTRLIWHKLGRSFLRTFKLTISDPVKIVLLYAALLTS